MKVEELLRLMVGDILYACYNEEGVDFRIPVIIDGIDNLGNDDCFIDWHPLGSEDSGDVHAEEFEPIPLAAEILEKNEWKYNKYSETWSPKDMSYYTFALNKKFEWVKKHETYGEEEYIANCNEIHLLQHALRLCGLADLADNFAI